MHVPQDTIKVECDKYTGYNRVSDWLVLQLLILRKSSGLLWGSRSSVVRALTGRVGGLVSNPQAFFFSQFASMLINHQCTSCQSGSY